MTKLIIRHIKSDAEIVARLARGLKAKGYSTWTCGTDGTGEAVYLDQVADAIAQADVIMFMLSAQALNTRQFEIELRHAQQSGKRVIALLRELTLEEIDRRNSRTAALLGRATTLCLTDDAQDAFRVLAEILDRHEFEPTPKRQTVRTVIGGEAPLVRRDTMGKVVPTDVFNLSRVAGLLIVAVCVLSLLGVVFTLREAVSLDRGAGSRTVSSKP
jgi:hypothetical protein